MNIDIASIRSLSFFKSLPETSIQLLIEHATKKYFDKDQTIFMHGDAAHSLYIIQQGWVKCTHNTLDGSESISKILTMGDCFGESALLPENAFYSSNVETITSCEVFVIPADILRRIIKEHHDLAVHFLSVITQNKSSLELQIEHLTTMSTSQRIGCFFLKLCNKQIEGDITLELPYDKSIIASYLGMKPETFSRGLSKLKDLGVTVDHHHVHISDITQLREFSCISCSNPRDCDED